MARFIFIKISIDLNNLLLDPRLWENVSSFPINDQDEIKIVYLQRGFFQPLGHNFPKKEICGVLRWFNPKLYVFAFFLNLFLFMKSIYSIFFIKFFLFKSFNDRLKKNLWSHCYNLID